jgi:2-dehydropantoate 2-reductase
MHSVGIMGAGSVGLYLGGCLQVAGASVVYVGRPTLFSALQNTGLRVTDYLGRDQTLAADALNLATNVSALAGCDLVLVTVKSAATAEVALELAQHLKPGAIVISFQNGVRNAEVLRSAIPNQTVLAGMVPFNVLNCGDGRFHQGSFGALDVAAHEGLSAYSDVFSRAGLAFNAQHDMRAVLWGKLLLNLNNAINALSNLPLKTELSQRDYRRCLSLAQREALALYSAAGIKPMQLTALPPHWLARLLTVPDWLFQRLAQRMLAMDPLARSSMWEDLEAGRRTEVDWIQGEVVALATEMGRTAPVNASLRQLIREAEQAGADRRSWSGAELLARLRSTSA